MEKKKIIDALNEALGLEYSVVIKFLTGASLIRGMQADPLRKFLKEGATGELTHAAALCDRIAALGGTPATSIPKISVSSDVNLVLKDAIAQEEALIASYQKLMKMVPKIENILLYETLEHLLEDELKDLEEFQRLAG